VRRGEEGEREGKARASLFMRGKARIGPEKETETGRGSPAGARKIAVKSGFGAPEPVLGFLTIYTFLFYKVINLWVKLYFCPSYLVKVYFCPSTLFWSKSTSNS
jgi:hypothetical protein